MKEFESCDKCKYHNRTEEELPCIKCTHNGCKDFYSPMTNGDRIRSMSDEELAELLTPMLEDMESCDCCIIGI